MDTVGAVCMDTRGNLCAGVSSGGVLYKAPGRIGQVSLIYTLLVIYSKKSVTIV